MADQTIFPNVAAVATRAFRGKDYPDPLEPVAAFGAEERPSLAPPRHPEKRSREAMTIHKMLPQYNCGKCGYKNCWAFAITVASSDSVPISNCHNFEINFFF